MEHWKSTLSIGALALLCSCAFLPSNFDNQEHARLVTIAHLTDSNEICQDPRDTRNFLQNLKHHVSWLKIYSRDLPNNGKMYTMVNNLDTMVAGFDQRYQTDDAVPSKFYCEQKVRLINEAASEIITASARRPR